MLEVGTGFHPELTGRENIFLNGAILGMSKSDIKKRFDEIVAFAEVERFLDTPVKRYSSGMYVRLAFAVAAHIEPEILIVDEVLAVGDAQFQKKCLGRMEEVGREGRTVIFVSHSMQAVKHLCNKGLMLDKGQLIFDGSIDEAVSLYLQKNVSQNENSIMEQLNSYPKDAVFSFDEIFIMQEEHRISVHGENGKSTEVNILFTVNESTPNLRVFFDVFDEAGNLIFRSFNDENQNGMSTLEAGRYHFKILLAADFFAPKKYFFKFNATIYNVRYMYREPLECVVEFERTGRANRSYPEEPIRGLIAPLLSWKNTK
ncbi:Teichoic acids export ATP-binding protein TagH [compost metagenome]